MTTPKTRPIRPIRRRRPRHGRTPHHPQPRRILTTAAAMAFLPTIIQSRADTNSSSSSPYSLFTQFENLANQNTVPFTARLDGEEEVVSNGTVYYTCPDLSYITGPLNDADVDNNGYLSQEEYVQFTNAISGGYAVQEGDGFKDMDLVLIETYWVLSCLCELFPDAEAEGNWGPGCCIDNNEENTGIRTDGTDPTEVPSEEELQYLTYVCGTMSVSLERLGGSIVAPPTGSPTVEPTGKVTARPTGRPTLEPSEKPTEQPTAKPTMPPSRIPTPKPTTQSPTSKPSKKPSQPPSPAPTTKRPTPSPVVPGDPTQSPVESSSPTPRPTPQPVVTKEPTPQPMDTQKPTTSQPIEPGTPTKNPTISPTVSSVPTVQPTSIPSDSPSVSAAPTGQPTPNPSTFPSQSLTPTLSSSPTTTPTTSSYPTSTSAPSRTRFTGDVPASVNFVASFNGQMSAEEIMEGETNQVKIMLEEQLLILSDIVIMEEFYNGTALNDTNGTDSGMIVTGATTGRLTTESTSSSSGGGELKLRRRVSERILIVEKATLATLDSVQDIGCPSTQPSRIEEKIALYNTSLVPTDCLNFSNTIVLYMVDELVTDEKVQIFETAMLAKLSDGWLMDNFDLEEALKPPPTPSPTPPKDVDEGTDGADRQPVETQSLSPGAIVGLIVAVLICLTLTVLFVNKYKRGGNSERNGNDDELDLERQQSPKDTELAKDGLHPSSAPVDDDLSSMSTATEDKSFSSQDHLLSGQPSSTANIAPALGTMPNFEDDSEVEDSIYSSSDQLEDVNRSTRKSSALGAMAAASTLVASSTSTPPRTPTGEMESYSPIDFPSDNSASTSDFPREEALSASPVSAGWAAGEAAGGAAAAVGAGGDGGGGGVATTAAEEGGGLSAGAAAAIGVGAAGVMAAGAYAVTRSSSATPEKEAENKSFGASTVTSGTPNAMDDLDNAIESGKWGQVGALAAVLAFSGQGSTPGKKSSRLSSNRSNDSSSSRGSSVHGGSSLDQARAVEIDKLVESGDWHGVVLAAARFEADQTFDGESISLSASASSRWTGSATSATTPRSMATTDQGSASNISSQRGQEEIRAEVEALVRRVVPEEADNIDEMMMQFKGREEELVETLRRMQERAIASRARLAVQKSAKLEARAKGQERGELQRGAGSSASVASGGSTKSELEQAIEAGNWQAVGLAAQKMSDSSVGDLSMDDKARLRDAISQSPAFSRGKRRSSDGDDFNLDKLIEQGDWQGVISAAKAASEGPDQSICMEEQDALAQANMWQEIADQSKQDANQGPAGAGDAAAWAISRSLNALNTSGESSTAARTINDIVDEQSTDASQYESSSNGSPARSREYTRGI
eukprot:CAMPEP_0172299208 /NCGR_PEP_ID=MMETSP1058-20130122/1563_1 /TAXON_ID=83371 /ORGANISM="Detonula confervacea, Strain CCMP 353" /LENGTH=1352 /DNA_ID=CAMNT_0013008569 /DNA_START=322 /DNA_END=4380 /DNA_ORIENTATION=+